MDHFLIQDSKVFTSCFEGQARGSSPYGHHRFCEGPPLPPPVSWLPISSTVVIQQGWRPPCEMWTAATACCCSVRTSASVAAITPSLPLEPPFCFLGSPSHCWESCRLLWLKQESPSNHLLRSWVGTWNVLISKAELKVVMRFHGTLSGLLHSRHKMS